jgi:hypothetical protein
MVPHPPSAQACKPGAVLALETGKYMLQLKKEQTDAFETKICDIATSAGWRKVEPPKRLAQPAVEGAAPALDAHVLFRKP